MNELVLELAARLQSQGWTLATAESCTGGWLGQELTAIPGSSDWYEGGIISYSNAVKQNILQVPGSTLSEYGAVSKQVALAMASGAQKSMHANLSVALTGIAGPGGGSVDKPVGTVWIAWRLNEQQVSRRFVFTGNRTQVRQQAVREALVGLLEMLEAVKK